MSNQQNRSSWSTASIVATAVLAGVGALAALMKYKTTDNERRSNQNVATDRPSVSGKVSQRIFDNNRCYICFQSLHGIENQTLPCSHVFHTLCLNKLNQNICAVCRAQFNN